MKAWQGIAAGLVLAALASGCGPIFGSGGDLSAAYQFRPATDEVSFSINSKACGQVATGTAKANAGAVGCVVATDGASAVGTLTTPK